MDGFSNKTETEKLDLTSAGVSPTGSTDLTTLVNNSKGSSLQSVDFKKALEESFGGSLSTLQTNATVTNAPASSGSSEGKIQGVPTDDHDHAPAGAGQFEFHVNSLDDVSVSKTLNRDSVGRENSLKEDIGARGDLLMPGGGKNTVIGSGDTDVIVGAGRGFNTITTGGGFDTIVLGAETTNRIFDFDPTKDRFVLASNVDASNIVIAQGKNKNKGGVGTPLDFEKNALVIDKSNNHILASLNFTDASKLSEGTFKKLNPFALVGLASAQFDNVKVGDGKQTGTQKRDLLVGKGGDDFLYVGDDGFKIGTATGSGPGEFPFPTDSPGTSEITGTLQNGVLKLNGSYKDFEAAPLFSQGEDSIDPNAKILNGSDPVALIEGFKKVPQDSEGNKLSGTHLHFSPSGDSRGNNADATVVRYLSESITDAKSGKISGEFELSSEEQAAFLAGNLYVNIHSNVDVDKDGKAGFPTGENRLNLNQNMVQLV